MHTIQVPVWLPHGQPDGSNTIPEFSIREAPFTWAELSSLFPEKHTRTEWHDLLGCHVEDEQPNGDGLIHKGNPFGPTLHGAVSIHLYIRNTGISSLWQEYRRVKGYALIWLEHLSHSQTAAEFSLRRDESSILPDAAMVRGLLIPQAKAQRRTERK